MHLTRQEQQILQAITQQWHHCQQQLLAPHSRDDKDRLIYQARQLERQYDNRLVALHRQPTTS